MRGENEGAAKLSQGTIRKHEKRYQDRGSHYRFKEKSGTLEIHRISRNSIRMTTTKNLSNSGEGTLNVFHQ